MASNSARVKQRIEQLWAHATTEFLLSAAGTSWPGEETNKQKLGEILIAMGTTDSPYADNLARAYAYTR